MAILLDENLEGGSNGATITTSNTTFSTVLNAPLFTNDSLFGSLAMDLATGAAGNRYGDTVFSTKTAIWCRFYVKLVSTTAQAYLVNCTSTLANLRVETTGALRARNATTAVGVVSTSVLSASTWTRVEYRLDFTAGQQQFRMYTGANLHGTTPDYDSGNLTLTTGSGITSIGFGSLTSVTGASYRMDAIAVSDTGWIGSAVAPAVTAPLAGSGALSMAVAAAGTVTANFTGSGALSCAVTPGAVTRTAAFGGSGALTMANLEVGGVMVLGDSLTGMSGSGTTYITNALAAHGWNGSKVHVSGITGRLIWGGSTHPNSDETIDTWRATGIDARVWIVGLGANNQGASQANLQSYYDSLLTRIGPGRVVHFIDQGFQGQSENTWSFNGGGSLGSRYSATSLSEVNAAIRNISDLANASPATYPTCVVHNWNDDTAMRAAGSSIWLSTDSSSIGGTARHMATAGYLNYRAPFYASAIDSELPPSTSVTAGFVGNGTLDTVVASPVAASLAGSGALSAPVVEREIDAAPFAGSGALSFAVAEVEIVTAPLAGSGALSFATVEREITTAPFAGTGTLSMGVQSSGGTSAVTASLTGTGTLSMATVEREITTAPFTGSAALSTTGGPGDNAPLAGSGNLSASVGVAVGAGFTGTGTLTAQVLAALAVAGAFSGDGDLSFTVFAVLASAITPESRIYAIAAEVRVYQLTRERRVLEVPS